MREVLKEQMRELLLNGLTLSAEYKISPEDWVGKVSIRIFEGGMGIQPLVIVDGDIHRMEVGIEYIYEAIQYFGDAVYSSNNLRFMHLQAMLNISKVCPNIDLEIDEEHELYEKERQWLVMKYNY